MTKLHFCGHRGPALARRCGRRDAVLVCAVVLGGFGCARDWDVDRVERVERVDGTPSADTWTATIESGVDDGEIHILNGSWFHDPDHEFVSPGALSDELHYAYFRFTIARDIPPAAVIEAESWLEVYTLEAEPWSETLDTLLVAAALEENPTPPGNPHERPGSLDGANIFSSSEFERDTPVLQNGSSFTGQIAPGAGAIGGNGSLLVHLEGGNALQWVAEGSALFAGLTTLSLRFDLAPNDPLEAGASVCAGVIYTDSLSHEACAVLDLSGTEVRSVSLTTDGIDGAKQLQGVYLSFVPDGTGETNFIVDSLYLTSDAPGVPRLTTPWLRWPESGGLVPEMGTRQRSPSLAEPLQELVATHQGLAAGSSILLWLAGSHTRQSHRLSLATDENDLDEPARLQVSWSAGE